MPDDHPAPHGHPAHATANRTAIAVAVAGAAIVPTLALILTGSGQPEVDVVRAGADHFWRTGSPYVDQPRELDDFRPYLPAMYLFGSLPGFLGDVRFWGAILLVAAIRFTRQLIVEPRRRVFDDHVGLLVAFPLAALAIAASGIDIPQAALTLIALSFLARARYLMAGAAIGLTAALKPTALCALFVLALCAKRRGGTRPTVALTVSAAAVAGVFTVPVALVDASGLWTNVVEFPAGKTAVTSPAGSPFPGVLLHDAGAPDWAQTLLVVVAALAVAFWCWRRVTAEPRSAALYIAIGWAAAFAVVPNSRAGYLVLSVLVYFPWRFGTRPQHVAPPD